jgi:hypothetical protein
MSSKGQESKYFCDIISRFQADLTCSTSITENTNEALWALFEGSAFHFTF